MSGLNQKRTLGLETLRAFVIILQRKTIPSDKLLDYNYLKTWIFGWVFMPENIVKSRNQIEDEIAKKRQELAELENTLAEEELAHATLENQLSFFQRRYHAQVGPLLAELDELNAQIAEAIAVLSPHDDDIQDEATEARAQAEKTFEEAYTFAEDDKAAQRPQKFTPTEDIKKLFREVAKKIHPDLVKNGGDKELRSHYMKEANQAYRDGNIKRLKEILMEWEASSTSEPENYLEAELEKINHLIIQIEGRIQEIREKIKLLIESEIGQLKIKADLAEDDGEDLLSQIELGIQRQINKKRDQILGAIETLSQSD